MTNVVEICQDTKYSLAEANALLPLVRRIGIKTDLAVEDLLKQQRYMVKTFAPKEKVDSYDILVCNELNRWGAKLLRLGLKLIGSGIILFDHGFGYWVYHVGKDSITHSLDYDTPVNYMVPLPVVLRDEKM